MDENKLNTFLFAWNPIKFEWPEISGLRDQVKRGEKVTEDWSCVSHKKIKKGDRAFLSIVGVEPRGIFGSGYVASEPFIGKSKNGKDSYRVLIEFDTLLNPVKDTILTLDIIKIGKMIKQQWTPQGSGISIKPEITEELEALWQDFLETTYKLTWQNGVANLR